MAAVHVDELGEGPTVVLVHGAVLHGLPTWIMQRQLARRWRLVIPDLPGFGASPAARRGSAGDVEAVAALVDGGCHLVGFSYGGVVAMLLAADRPSEIASLTLIEPPVFQVAPEDAEVAELRSVLGAAFRDHDDDPEGFLHAFGAVFGLRSPTTPLNPILERNVRTMIGSSDAPWEVALPIAALAKADFPKLVVSSGDRRALDLVCDTLASSIGGERRTLPGAGHQVQYLGPSFNRELEAFLSRAGGAPHPSAGL